jgi:hypothetical protein
MTLQQLLNSAGWMGEHVPTAIEGQLTTGARPIEPFEDAWPHSTGPRTVKIKIMDVRVGVGGMDGKEIYHRQQQLRSEFQTTRNRSGGMGMMFVPNIWGSQCFTPGSGLTRPRVVVVPCNGTSPFV